MHIDLGEDAGVTENHDTPHTHIVHWSPFYAPHNVSMMQCKNNKKSNQWLLTILKPGLRKIKLHWPGVFQHNAEDAHVIKLCKEGADYATYYSRTTKVASTGV